eukprot:TRINITY_DN804_c0_g1_i4.p1 TRINITY_DN804_c0_g1~~TRINITY_DN804_c0_g1_i4.p1  ORF type:complete len:205 (+),score=26.43 TRINITY_DN804_c0_g1_i4:41-616(+)
MLHKISRITRRCTMSYSKSHQDNWKPNLYGKFQQERQQPFNDLVSSLKSPTMQEPYILDVGCGSGETDVLLFQNFGGKVLGVDNSQAMLDKAKTYQNDNIEFQLCNIEEIPQKYPDNNFDVVFANASLHWVDNHKELLPKLIKKLKKNGSIGIQMPTNHTQKFYVLMRNVAKSPEFEAELKVIHFVLIDRP